MVFQINNILVIASFLYSLIFIFLQLNLKPLKVFIGYQ